MSTVAPWLIPPNFLGAIEAGTQAGLAKRRLGDEEDQFSQRMAEESRAEQGRQADAADRLRLSYDSLAQQHDLSRQEIAARQVQAQAADALRQHAQDSLTAWRQQQVNNQNQRLKDQETKLEAATTLREKANNDINGFWSDLPAKGLAQSLQDHPYAAAEPGIRQAAAQKLINPKADPAAKELNIKYNLPESGGTATGPLPLLQRQFGTNLPQYLQSAAPADALTATNAAPPVLGGVPSDSGAALSATGADAPANLNIGYKSPVEVRAAFKAGSLTKDEAVQILKDQFQME